MSLKQKQLETKQKIEQFATMLGLNPTWAVSISMVESSLGLNQKSKTGAKGVFQMTPIAMKDLLIEMETSDDDYIDILCGLLFLRVLINRWKTIEKATAHFCDPADIPFYIDRMKKYMKEFSGI